MRRDHLPESALDGLDPAGELIRCDERDRLAPPPPDEDGFTPVRDLIHQRGQALSGLRIAGQSHRDRFGFRR